MKPYELVKALLSGAVVSSRSASVWREGERYRLVWTTGTGKVCQKLLDSIDDALNTIGPAWANWQIEECSASAPAAVEGGGWDVLHLNAQDMTESDRRAKDAWREKVRIEQEFALNVLGNRTPQFSDYDVRAYDLPKEDEAARCHAILEQVAYAKVKGI